MRADRPPWKRRHLRARALCEVSRRRRVALGAVAAALALLPLRALGSEDAAPVRYATTRMLEPDRCATAWVVHRYLDPEARFEFHEREKMPEGVVLFDLPEAEFKRDARRATVEVLIESAGIDEPFARRLAQLIHDIEINAWARRDEAASLPLERALMDRIVAAGPPEKGLAVCFDILDLLESCGGDVTRLLEKLEDREASEAR